MLSGLGVPDLLGTWGSSTAHRPDQVLRDLSGLIRDDDPRPAGVEIPLQLERTPEALRLECQGQRFILRIGEWSDWVSLHFGDDASSPWRAIARFYLRSLEPDLNLYLSPLEIDPRAPCLPLTYPLEYAQQLVARHGLYHTLGWPEDATGLSEGRLDEAGFLSQVKEAFREQAAMALAALDEGEDDLLIAVFEATDRVQHLFWDQRTDRVGLNSQDRRGLDCQDPILRSYQAVDALVGEVWARLRPEDTLLVCSDHGAKPVTQLVHLNAWLREHGYLALLPGEGKRARIDWGRTRAYAIGLSKIYVNLKGRERQGIVGPGREYEALCQQLVQELLDPTTGLPGLLHVYRSRELYQGPYLDRAGDLVVGFQSGYRTSSQTATGGVPASVVTPNRKRWRADHCSLDPALVPGVLLCNRPLAGRTPSLLDLAPTILRLLDVPVPEEMEGRSLV